MGNRRIYVEVEPKITRRAAKGSKSLTYVIDSLAFGFKLFEHIVVYGICMLHASCFVDIGGPTLS